MSVKDYLVKFYNMESGWLHSEVNVSSETPGKVMELAVKSVLDKTGEDVSRHRAAVVYADNGEGVASLDNAMTKAQLTAQLAQLTEQLKRLPDEDSPSTEVTPPPVTNADTVANPAFNPANSQVAPDSVSTAGPRVNAPLTEDEINAQMAQLEEQRKSLNSGTTPVVRPAMP
jgi:hypothetical protein